MQEYKQSEDLEIYEMDYNNNIQLQEICNVKQPIIFDIEPIFPTIIENPKDMSEKYGKYEVRVKNTDDYSIPKTTGVDISIDSAILSLNTAYKLFQSDSASHYYTENNQEFLDESGLVAKVAKIDEYIKPNLSIVNTKYDYISGSDKTTTPLRYHFDSRHFYVVISGKLKVKMTPWKSSKYLDIIKDYEKYEFRSPVNVWDNSEKELEKIRFLEFDIKQGDVLYIPPYWWYSIQFSNSTALYSITYNSFINVLSHSMDWVRYFIQQQNITTKVSTNKKTQSEIVEHINNSTNMQNEEIPNSF
jgi:mannose-6-phosphate isomerase-like protein (cupin superfamily)